jgi:hypothetical protein
LARYGRHDSAATPSKTTVFISVLVYIQIWKPRNHEKRKYLIYFFLGSWVPDSFLLF